MAADVKATVDVILIDDKAEKETDITANVCAKYVHNEDNTIGILVKDPQGCPWTLYGDKCALDRVNNDSRTRCTQQAPSPASYQVWTFAPTLESANSRHQTLATLYTFKDERRKVIKNRRLWNFKMDWWFWSSALECKTSGWWNYPITMNGLQNIIPWSAVAVTTPGVWHIHVFYQQPGGGILQSEHLNGLWGGEPSKDPIFNAVLFTPLAAINFNGGKEVRVYYLDGQYVLQEYCYSAHKGRWFPGELGDMKIQAATNTSIAAIQYGDDCGGVHIRVYCQELASGAIKELCNDGYWFRGATLPVTLSGSSLAAVAYWCQLRVYYQTDDLSIEEHCIDERSKWFPGELDIGKAPGCVPISALGYVTSDGAPRLHVYWRNLENQIVGMKSVDSWGPVHTVVGGLKADTQFAAAQWSNGENLRLYYQTPDDSVLEMVNDAWVGGATVGNAR
ncbi:uncharacterized protein ARMOST_17796 [Armillaria ostoyae]|uniref:Uncharacterized protein n=1 Tax=Armillaria ostoyae TaxID=47428 RepID=A0A284S009_ARMOS|nr:uncharacterized protein ARMOST_17796 [Armillaria ostoyae]